MSKLLTLLTSFALFYSSFAMAETSVILHVFPRTESIEVIDGDMKQVLKQIPYEPFIGAKKLFMVHSPDTTVATMILNDGIYKILIGQHENAEVSTFLISVNGNKISMEKAVKGSFTILNFKK